MSQAASLPGAELFLRNRFFVEQATCLGQLRCLGQNFLLKMTFLNTPLVTGSFAAWGRTSLKECCVFWTSPLSRAASLPGAELFLKKDFFLNKPLGPDSFAVWGRTFLKICAHMIFLNTPLVPGSFAAWGRTFSQKRFSF